MLLVVLLFFSFSGYILSVEVYVLTNPINLPFFWLFIHHNRYLPQNQLVLKYLFVFCFISSDLLDYVQTFIWLLGLI